MTTLAMNDTVRNLCLQNRKLAGRYGTRLTRSPEVIAAFEHPTALAWTSLFRHLDHIVNQGV